MFIKLSRLYKDNWEVGICHDVHAIFDDIHGLQKEMDE